MKPSTFRKVVKKLDKKFDLVEDGTDHIAYEIWHKGVYITRVKNSHSSNDQIDNYIAKNLHISTSHLREFIACSFTNDKIIEEMKKKCYWPEE